MKDEAFRVALPKLSKEQKPLEKWGDDAGVAWETLKTRVAAVMEQPPAGADGEDEGPSPGSKKRKRDQ